MISTSTRTLATATKSQVLAQVFGNYLPLFLSFSLLLLLLPDVHAYPTLPPSLPLFTCSLSPSVFVFFLSPNLSLALLLAPTTCSFSHPLSPHCPFV